MPVYEAREKPRDGGGAVYGATSDAGLLEGCTSLFKLGDTYRIRRVISSAKASVMGMERMRARAK